MRLGAFCFVFAFLDRSMILTFVFVFCFFVFRKQAQTVLRLLSNAHSVGKLRSLSPFFTRQFLGTPKSTGRASERRFCDANFVSGSTMREVSPTIDDDDFLLLLLVFVFVLFYVVLCCFMLFIMRCSILDSTFPSDVCPDRWSMFVCRSTASVNSLRKYVRLEQCCSFVVTIFFVCVFVSFQSIASFVRPYFLKVLFETGFISRQKHTNRAQALDPYDVNSSSPVRQQTRV
jgi:hypothetical protein